MEGDQAMTGMKWHRYPDPGGIGSDRDRLQFAVHFATTQRAFGAARIYSVAAEDLTEAQLQFLAIDAFEEKMHGVEDTLGWIHALRLWIPDDGRSLFPLLDSVRLEREEDGLSEFLDELDGDELRSLLRVRLEDLDSSGIREEIRQQIIQSVPHVLDGLRRLIHFRTANERRTARMFNKSKHMLQGVVKRSRDGTHAIEFISGSPPETVGRIIVTPANIRTLAAESIVLQAALHSMLAAILMTHYQELYASPDWIRMALDLPEGWHDGDRVQRLVMAVR